MFGGCHFHNHSAARSITVVLVAHQTHVRQCQTMVAAHSHTHTPEHVLTSGPPLSTRHGLFMIVLWVCGGRSPSCPWWLLPQPYTAPLSSRKKVWLPAAATCTSTHLTFDQSPCQTVLAVSPMATKCTHTSMIGTPFPSASTNHEVLPAWFHTCCRETGAFIIWRNPTSGAP